MPKNKKIAFRETDTLDTFVTHLGIIFVLDNKLTKPFDADQVNKNLLQTNIQVELNMQFFIFYTRFL